MSSGGTIGVRAGRTWLGVLLLAALLATLGSTAVRADDCSSFPNGVVDGNFVPVPPSNINIDTNCTLRNYPGGMSTNFSFMTQPGQTDERWLVIFDNVVHTGQMSCNAVQGHHIWFVNGSSTGIHENCQNLFVPVEKIDKQNVPVGQTTATIGVPFTWKLVMPVLFDPLTGTVIDYEGSVNDLHSVTVTDDLNAIGVDLTFLSERAYIQGTNTPVPHTFVNSNGFLTFDNFPIIPAGQQIIVEITVVLNDSPVNAVGTQFSNTAKWDFGRLIDDVFYEPLPGEWGISPPLTIAAPQLVMTKTGPTTLGRTLNLGEWGQFGLDIQNTGLTDAWDVTIVDRLPDGPTGGMCALTPEVLSARVFAADGTTPVPGKGPLVAGTDYTVSYAGAPTCELTLTMLTPAAAIGPSQRLIISYRTQLDPDTQNGASLTNVAGATQWFNGDISNPDRIQFDRTLTNGTPGTADHEDAHTVQAILFGYFFEKTVANLDAGTNPATFAAPGERVRYTLRLQTTDGPLDDMRFFDDLGAMNPTVVFQPGSLVLVPGTIPPGADISNTDPNGGTNNAGIIDIRNLDLPANSQVSISFDVTVAGTATNGTVVTNQSDLFGVSGKLADSDDPTVNGQSDPSITGDEDPTRFTIGVTPPPALAKANTQATAAVGDTFRYRITVPTTPHNRALYDVRILDDLTASAADLSFVSVAKISGSATWTPVNTGTATNLVIEDPVNGIDIPAGEQVTIEITVVLLDMPTNTSGLQFTNTADYTYDTVNGSPPSQQPGAPGTTAPMTIVEPGVTLEKSGPALMILSDPETFTLDVHNTSATPAWNLTITDRLPDTATGGTCDAAPTAIAARVFQADGVTPVSGPLVQGTDFTALFVPNPTCELTFTMVSAAAVVGPDQRLIVTYETQIDADSQNGAALTNVAGATQWFSAAASSPGRRTYTRTITDGTVGTLDHQDAHTATAGVAGFLFEKTVMNVTSGADPATTAAPGDRLRYSVRIVNLGTTPLTNLGVYDELDRMNSAPGCTDGTCFQPGTLALITVPPGADTSNTSATGGPKGTGVVNVTNLSAAPGATVLVEFEITLEPVIGNGTLVANQAALRENGTPLSDDPNVNGPSDPFNPNDQDPTVVQIVSAPRFRVQKVSDDVTGDPNLLLAGETLRYTITVKNTGSADATDAMLRDAVPTNTSYVAGSTRLNGSSIPDGPGGTSPLASGILIHAPENATPGAMRADASATTTNVATIVFDIVIDAGVVDGTIISNQGFVSAPGTGVFDQPSDDPATVIPDDPTRDVVGSVPLLFAPKAAALLIDNGSPGIVDPLDTLHYTITIYNTGSVPATGIVLTDSVPANTTYVANSTTLNGAPFGQPDGGVAPLTGGIPIPDIAPGQNAVVGFNLQVNAGVPSGTIISNQATVTTNETPNLLTDGDGNPATGPEPTIVVVGDQQQLTITKQVAVVGGGPVLAGSTLEYVVLVTNVASVPAQGVVLTDDLDAVTPGYLTLVAGSATLNGVATGVTEAGSLVTADYSTTYGPLAPGATAVLRFRAVVGAAVPNGTTITNLGVVTWNTNQTANASVSVQVGFVPGVGVLSGMAWHDADFDDVFDPTRPLVGWTVELLRNNALIASVVTDGAGAYQINAVPPNDANGDQYVLRFRAPGAGLNTAPLGIASSAFTNGPQQISNIIVPSSGANLTDLNLPIDPNGVVYGALSRTPVAGATVTMLDAGSGAQLPTSCFLDPAQQSQVTLASGFYKFDVVFGLGCSSGGAYLIAVTPPGAGSGTGISALIPPTSDQTTPAFSVPTCPGTPGVDAELATLTFCEAQLQATAPVPPAPTTYYLHFTLDNSGGAGSAQLFNNHVPLDPTLSDLVAITKTTPSLNVSRGQLVPYEITVNNTQGSGIADLAILDRFPRGFHYVEGSARIEGLPVEPVTTGFEMLWLVPDGLPALTQKKLVMLLAVGAGVSEGEFTNRAQAVSGTNPTIPYSGEAFATVRVVPDPTFDCTDVVGKVFDDANHNGMQEKGERGLAGVRLVTARGLVASTDPHGRFHITCAVVPREDRGSNFVLKLDDRSLPTGYRMTTRQVQVQRATRGKVLPFHFGAAIARVIGIDIADAVFEPNTAQMREQWKPRIALLVEELAKGEAILRLSYLADVEDPAIVDERIAVVKKMIGDAWQAKGGAPIAIETEVYWRRGAPPAGSTVGGALQSMLPSVDAGPPLRETTPGPSVEHQMPGDLEFQTWAQDPESLESQAGDKIERREVTTEGAKIVKLKNVVPAIHFESGVADIPPSTIAKLRSVLESMHGLQNVRLHLVGHADNEPLSPALTGVFGDNQGLSRERAGEVAEFIQTALALPPEAISFDWAGDTAPIASNATEAGRAQNRRVEVEVWYDEPEAKASMQDVVVHEDIKRVKICRTETVCKLRYQEGQAKRARVKNLIAPLHYADENVQLSEDFVGQIGQALHDLRDKQHVTVKFIAFTDDAPLSERAQRIYGTPLALSKAIAHRVSLSVKDALALSTAAIASDGRGALRPIASNETDRGRALNRRVEVELWYDDPLQDLPDEPQICPDGAGAELVTKVYDPPWGPIEALQLDHGEAQVPAGYTEKLQRALGEIADKTHPRLRFIGYTRNERLDRRTALVYGDDVGLSTARAHRALQKIQAALGLRDAQVEHEGRGFVSSDDVVNSGFVQGDQSTVVVQAVYDELAALDDYEGVEVTPMTRELAAKDPLALNLMRITVDGQPIDDPGRSVADIQRCTDVALDHADIQFKFDDLKAVPRLSVTAAPIAATAAVEFRAYTNYAHWIDRSEVRIFERGQSLQAEPLAVLPVDAEGRAQWQPDAEAPASPQRELVYVLRAVDKEGQFDETEPQSLWLVHGEPTAANPADPALLAGYGETGPATRNIPLGNVGTVQVHGRGVPAKHDVFVAGTRVPVDEQGSFVGEVVLPKGMHTVEVAVLDEQGNGELFLRDLEMKRDDWFYVGIADLTVEGDLEGKNRPKSLEGHDAPYDSNSDFDGRLAFYTTGKFWDDWKLTASADTREEPIEDLFKDFVKKTPESLFRRIDPDYHYPAFGDDGTVDETAPTSGKFYVRVDQRENRAMWGNFKVGYLENELVQIDRGLYGANVHYQTLAATRHGEQRVSVDGFAAEPGTVPSREEFRGTDGSLYFLRRQDILSGSERLRVEVRDKDSGLVTGVVHLRPTVDYDIDYLQGRILLTDPLESTVADRLLVHSNGVSGDEAWLVVQYEFTPGFDEIDSLAAGGTGALWVTDWLKVGLTGNRNNNEGDDDSSLYGGDVTARLSTESWLKVQAGRSEGLITSAFRSDDGGFLFAGIGSAATLSEAEANGYRADVSLGVADFIEGGRGQLALYGQLLDEGYAGPGMTALTDTQQFGGVLGVPITQALSLTAKADERDQDDGLKSRAAEVDLGYALTENWSIGTGVRNDRREDESPVVPLTQEEGERTDAVVKLGYDTQGRWRAYTFGQGTVARSGDRESNSRGGVGGAYRLNDRMAVDGEVSGGELGPAVKLGTRYQETKDTQHYLSYAFENEREYGALHERRGTLISGMKTRISDSSSVYLEDRYQHGDATGLARAMGMNFAPTDRWTLGANWGLGTLVDHQTHAETKRNAGGARLSYGFEDLHISSGVEYRFDKTQQANLTWTKRTTWLFRNNFRWQVTPSARLLGKANHSFSDSSLGDFYNGGYTELVLGTAYRPVEFDRLHVLAKYTYFENMPTTDQVTLQNTAAQYIQRSHVAALDVTYDLNQYFSLGGKYAYRLSQVSLDRDDPHFFDNNAHLYIVRGDYRFLKNWEGTLEGRMLDLTDLDERKTGALFTVYRHLGDNLKVGVGYNFTDFSDDLTDLSYDHQGVFFNLVGTL
jgi:uncharacterized repeat protein (TIGR01451 family)/fimbrial isopeptide formation D2 family protein